jgi:hypothetical protein
VEIGEELLVPPSLLPVSWLLNLLFAPLLVLLPWLLPLLLLLLVLTLFKL